jgi:acetyl-CoA C-acetyltransferase
MREVVIVCCPDSDRKFRRDIERHPARTLGALAVKAAIERAGIDPASIDEVLIGSVLQGGLGPEHRKTGCTRCRLAHRSSSHDHQQSVWFRT